MATLAAGFVRFLGFLFPVVATPLFTSHLGRYDFTFTTAQPLAALVVIVVTAINYFSVRMGGAIQVLLTSLKMGTILVIVVGRRALRKPHAIECQRHSRRFGIHGLSLLDWGTIGALLTALVPAMWAYNGFNDLGDLGEEILHPAKEHSPSDHPGTAHRRWSVPAGECRLFPHFAIRGTWRNRSTSRRTSCNPSPALAELPG